MVDQEHITGIFLKLVISHFINDILTAKQQDDSLWTCTHSDIIISWLCLKFSKDEYDIRIERYRKVVATIYVVVVIVVRVLWMRGYHTTISYVVASIAFS